MSPFLGVDVGGFVGGGALGSVGVGGGTAQATDAGCAVTAATPGITYSRVILRNILWDT